MILNIPMLNSFLNSTETSLEFYNSKAFNQKTMLSKEFLTPLKKSLFRVQNNSGSFALEILISTPIPFLKPKPDHRNTNVNWGLT